MQKTYIMSRIPKDADVLYWFKAFMMQIKIKNFLLYPFPTFFLRTNLWTQLIIWRLKLFLAYFILVLENLNPHDELLPVLW